MKILRIAKRIITKPVKHWIFSRDDWVSTFDQIGPDDIYVVGFPKSGNTWMQSIMAGLLYGIHVDRVPDKMTQVLCPDIHMNPYFVRVSPVMAFKSHEAKPGEQHKRVIYLIRDVRDVLLSYYHMLNSQYPGKYSLKQMMMEQFSCGYGKWGDHVHAWTSNVPDSRDQIVVRYEDLLEAAVPTLQTIGQFVGLKMPSDAYRDLADRVEFSKMKAREKQFGMASARWDPKNTFFRQGKSSAYKQEVDKNTLAAVTAKHKLTLTRFGYGVDC